MGLVFVNQIAKNITSSGFVKVLAAMPIFFHFPKDHFYVKQLEFHQYLTGFVFSPPS